MLFLVVALLPFMPSSGSQPNILYVLVDDLGYGDIGYTSSDSDIPTPFLDSLAHEGLILERHYTAWLCTPTRASLLTGKHPVQLGIQSDVFRSKTLNCLDRDELLLPEVMRSNGYSTHLVGKWHLGYAEWSCIPCTRGFDTSYGLLSGYHNYYNHTFEGAYDMYECEYDKVAGRLKSWTVLNEEKGLYLNDLMLKRAKEVITRHNETEDGPLFLYLPTLTPHIDNDFYYNVPKRYYYCNDTSRCDLGAMVVATEHMIKEIIGYLEDAGMWDNTLMVLTSDNGAPNRPEQSNGELRGWKYELWEGGVRTVGFMYSPSLDILPHRGVTDCLVHISDWYETLVTVSGGWERWEEGGRSRPEHLYSVDQTDYLIRGTTEECPRTELLVHIDPVRQVAAYIKGEYKLLLGRKILQDWKYIASPACDNNAIYHFNIRTIDHKNSFLFNIYQDPGETVDLSDQLPGTANSLKHSLLSSLGMQADMKCQENMIVGSLPLSYFRYFMPFWSNGTLIEDYSSFQVTFQNNTRIVIPPDPNPDSDRTNLS